MSSTSNSWGQSTSFLYPAEGAGGEKDGSGWREEGRPNGKDGDKKDQGEDSGHSEQPNEKKIQGEETEGERIDTKRNDNITFSVITNTAMR